MKANLTDFYVQKGYKPLKQREKIFDTKVKALFWDTTGPSEGSFNIRLTDEYGRQRQKKIGDAASMPVKTAREIATKLLFEAQTNGTASIFEGRDLRACPTFAEFVAVRYLPHAKSTKSSWDTDESMLRNHLVPHFGAKVLAEIRVDDIQNFYQLDLARGAARGSANRRIVLLRYIFNLAMRWEVPGVTKNPAKGVMLPDPKNGRERYLNNEEMVRLQRAVEESPNQMLRYIIPALLLTGTRKREVLDAKWSDIDLAKRTWKLPHTKTGPRQLQMSDALVKLLENVPRYPGCEHAFPNPATKKPFVSIFYAWNTARKKAGLPEVRIHDLRHTFASLLINAQCDLYVVMQMLGHTQMRTTMRYAHLSTERKRAAAQAAAQLSGLVDLLPQRSANNDAFTKAA